MILILLLTACSDDEVTTQDKIPSVEPIEAAMKTMTPLGYAASIFMDTINETNPANTVCDDAVTSLCVTTLEIPFDEQTRNAFPVPLEAVGTAKLGIAGLWNNSLAKPFSAAIVTLLFIDMKGGSFGFPTYEITKIPVTRSELGISTYYSTSDLSADKGTSIDKAKDELKAISEKEFNDSIDLLATRIANVISDVKINYTKDYWVVNVEDANLTPGNYFDDLYGLSGGGIYFDVGINSGSAYQIGVANVELGNNCKINPTTGKAFITEFAVNGDDTSSLFELGSALLAFDSTCDGQALVELGLGSYGPIKDARVPLRFNE